MSATHSLKRFELFETSKKLAVACYALTAKFPPAEQTLLTHYLRKAVLSAHIGIAQGAFMKKKKRRKKLLRQAKDALIVLDAALDVALEAALAKAEDATEVQRLSSTCYQLLSRWKKRD